jgi:TRAP-type mannitol/chloroaromatic compound transport system permease large subunit
VAAQVIAMALISMPVMIRYGYNMRYITGVLAASGTITQLVPPSLVLIVLADQLGKSVGDMYLGAWGPSVFQIMLFAGYTFLLGLVKPDHVPPVPKEARTLTGWALWKKCLMGIIPSAVLIFVVLGTMMMGLATPTEAGAMGAVGAIVLAAIHHKDFSTAGHRILIIGVIAAGIGTIVAMLYTENLVFKLAFAITYLAVVWVCLEAVRIPDLRSLIKQGYETTMRITCMVTFILIGSTCFSVVFLGVSGGVWLEHLLTSLPGGVWGFLIFINIFIFFVAFFLDFFEIAFIILPMIAPGAGGRPRRRLDLVRRHALRQHADLVPASAVRLRAVLSARRRAEGGQELGHLLGRHALDRPAGHHGDPGDRLPDHGHRPARQGHRRRPQQGQDRSPADRFAAAGFRAADQAVADVCGVLASPTAS